ncbi:MAG: glycosyltransferase family 39 protein, partial [Gemmatimonadota bacterium]
MTGALTLDRRSRLLLWAVLLLALGLRLYGLQSQPWDQDELYTLRDAADLGAYSQSVGGPGIAARPIYYLITWGLLKVAAPGPLMARFPAFLFGVAGVWVTWLLGRAVFGIRAGLLAAFLVAISPWHLYSSQFARYWTLVYLCSALACLWLIQAFDRDRPRDWAAAALIIMTGLLTHPTFAFPLVGIVAGLTLVGADGAIRWRWPTANALRYFWGTLLALAATALLVMKLVGSRHALSNWSGRGLVATVLLVPAIVEWLSPTLAATAAAGMAGMAWGPRDRRFALVALLGCGGALTLLLAASLRGDVYADYGMAMLPLVFVVIGGAVERLSEPFGSRAGLVAGGAAVVLAASTLPSTISHLNDGTRFDYRPAYEFVAAQPGNHLVMGWPDVVAHAYAPGIRFKE